jgi:hypothetical protein
LTKFVMDLTTLACPTLSGGGARIRDRHYKGNRYG